MTRAAAAVDTVRYEPPPDFGPLLLASQAKADQVRAQIEVVKQLLISKEPSSES